MIVCHMLLCLACGFLPHNTHTGAPIITGTVVRATSVTLSFSAPTNTYAGTLEGYSASCVPKTAVEAASGNSGDDANGTLGNKF